MLDLLIKSAVRRKIIGLFAINHTHELYARQVAREIDESPHAVGLELKALVTGGLLTRAEKNGRIVFRWNAAYSYADLLQQLVQHMQDRGDPEACAVPDFRWRERLQRELNALVREIVEKYQPNKIIVFGSMVTGRVRDGSDIDLVVIKETSLPFTKRVMQLVDLLHYTVDVDLLVYTPKEVEEALQNNQFIQEEIIAKGKVLYDKAA